MRDKKGFTLIELVTVLAILGVVLAIAVPAYRSFAEEAVRKADADEAALLTRATELHAAEQNRTLDTVFAGTENDAQRLGQLHAAGRIAEEQPAPQQDDAFFSWDQAETRWIVSEQDPYVRRFVDALATGAATLSDFRATSQAFAIDYDEYGPQTWNGYLEKVLEQSDYDSAVNVRDSADSGSNNIGYENPFHEGDRPGTVINNRNWNQFAGGQYPEYTPPAVLVTGQGDFSHDRGSIKESWRDTLKGTMVFYKDNSWDHDDTQVYYIREDGTFSDLTPLEDVLP